MAIRNPGSNAPVTQEEIAWKLFELVSSGTQKLEPEKAFALFARCLFAVRDPQDVWQNKENYHINPHQD